LVLTAYVGSTASDDRAAAWGKTVFQLSFDLVGSRTDAVLRRSSLSVSPCFLWECLTNPTVSPFPAPATSNGACGFPALRSLVRFATSFMRPPWPAMLSEADLMVSLYSTFANRFCLLLVVYPRPQVLQITGRFYHGAPASRGGQGVTVQQGSFAPWELPQFIATTNRSVGIALFSHGRRNMLPSQRVGQSHRRRVVSAESGREPGRNSTRLI